MIRNKGDWTPKTRVQSPLFLIILRRTDLEIAEVHLKPLRLQQDLAGRGEDVIGFVDDRAIDGDAEAIINTPAIDRGTRAEGALQVVLAAGIEQLLEERFVLRPPELTPAGERRGGAAVLPARLVVRPDGDVAHHAHRDGLALLVLAADD